MLNSTRVLQCALGLLITLSSASAQDLTCPEGGETIIANVVALDQPIFYNRLGGNLPTGMIYALERDVCPTSQLDCYNIGLEALKAAWESPMTDGGVVLRRDKRPRPLVLRVNQGQCLEIRFTNLLQPIPKEIQGTSATKTIAASIHIQGAEWLNDEQDDGSWTGKNTSSLANPGQTKIYRLFARHEGTFLLYSAGDTIGASPPITDGGQQAQGLFGALNVQPRGAESYRSQVTRADLALAQVRTTDLDQPVLDYQAVYPAAHARDGSPILRMHCKTGDQASACEPNEIVHSDLTAIITGPSAGLFPADERLSSYALPDRQEPYRELTIIYHEVFKANQAFPLVYANVLNVDGFGADNFAINYGIAGIGSEILANRFGVGPMGECTGCKYEEFFLSSWAVGDPAMIVDRPATDNTHVMGYCSNTGPPSISCDPQAAAVGGSATRCPDNGVCLVQVLPKTTDPKPATKAYYPDDPSNVYHSYLSDHTTFRVLHGGVDLHHVHHQHAHQWLHSPNSPEGDYLDSQSIGPGSSFTLEMVYGGSGNVNQTVGDSIFHCHFYPHFAMGMWSLWRVHDVYEAGTMMAGGQPSSSGPNRALPDGEITAGTPIPAVVPLPTRPLPPWPAAVRLADDGKTIKICPDDQNPESCVTNMASSGLDPAQVKNPGFPFYIPGLAGQRPPHPPMDFARTDPDVPTSSPLDGGLPRHLLRPCADGTCTKSAALLAPGGEETVSFFDFSKTLLKVDAFELPEEGTAAERLAMSVHGRRFHPTCEGTECARCLGAGDCDQKCQVDGSGNLHRDCQPAFILNGLPPTQGAPYADPCINYSAAGGVPPSMGTDRYMAADIQVDAVFNDDTGWHFPQLRMISLWDDVTDTLSGQRPPEPLFFRVNSGDCINYTLANLVPSVYELDDFQVRTPTDILGQHIHLVKFDVTSSDGAANGWNYEDGTFSPDEVMERIQAINHGGGLAAAHGVATRRQLSPKTVPHFGPGPGGRWMGAQATVQRFYADPLLNGRSHDPSSPDAEDRTIRTVFTHDHFSPSTNQQGGLYAGLVVEPSRSTWFDNATGQQMGSRADGGPTSWQAVIQTEDTHESFREFMLLLQDTTLTYKPFQDFSQFLPSGGFCSDNGAACTPATVAAPDADTSGCAHSSTAVCFAYGFCSDNFAPCKPGTWTSLVDVSGCQKPSATCNMVPGIPGQPVVGYPLVTTLKTILHNDVNGNIPAGPPAVLAPVATWGSVPIDAPAKSGPELISLSGGTYSFSTNYRNEPLYPRITTGTGPGDLSEAYSSSLYGDPKTPLMQAYAGDDIQVRTLVGAHINPHHFTVHDVKWLSEPSMVDSGWRASQVMGISEHFEELFRLPPWVDADSGTADYLYMSGAAAAEQAGGNWGILRAFGSRQDHLRPLPQNAPPAVLPSTSQAPSVCPSDLPEHQRRRYNVVAARASDMTAAGLSYNQRYGISDPDALVYFDASRLYHPSSTCTASHAEDPQCACSAPSTSCKLKPGYALEPLVLRAAAGDCIEVTLHNLLPPTPMGGAASPNLPPNTWTAANAPFLIGNLTGCGLTKVSGSATPCLPSNVSTRVGLHPQLVTYDVTTSNGFDVGNNPTQTVAAGDAPVSYTWYAGNVDPQATPPWIPIEFGATNLLPSDVINHYQHGLFGALIIEPPGSSWQPLPNTRGEQSAISARITKSDGTQFREHVLITQDGLNLNTDKHIELGLVNDTLNAVNYKSEPLAQRKCGNGARTTLDCVFSNTATCDTTSSTTEPCGEPETPIFTACAGEEVRLRLLHPGGINTNQVFELAGHIFAETPYESSGPGCDPPTTHTNLHASSLIGDGLECVERGIPNETEWMGSRMGHGPSNHYDVVLDSAGGFNAVPGDYLYRTASAMHLNLGLWGLFRVVDPATDSQMCPSGLLQNGGFERPQIPPGNRTLNDPPPHWLRTGGGMILHHNDGLTPQAAEGKQTIGLLLATLCQTVHEKTVRGRQYIFSADVQAGSRSSVYKAGFDIKIDGHLASTHEIPLSTEWVHGEVRFRAPADNQQIRVCLRSDFAMFPVWFDNAMLSVE